MKSHSKFMTALRPAAAAAALALSGGAAHAAGIVDGGFEDFGTFGPAGFCYFNSNCTYSPWNGGSGGGLQGENNAAFPGTETPDGSQYAFIQNLGFVAQTFSVAESGQYRFAWTDAGRRFAFILGVDGNQTYDVTLAPVGNDQAAKFALSSIMTLYTGSTVTDQPFTARSSGPVDLDAGAYTLSFNGLRNEGNHTAFIDAVSMSVVSSPVASAVPEPATWAMMIVGFGAIGVGMRRQNRSTLRTGMLRAG